MTPKIFINLPVENIERAGGFYEKLGFVRNPEFSNDTAICIVISESIYVMLLLHPFFQGFTKKELVNTENASQAIFALYLGSHKAVDDFFRKIHEAGPKNLKMPEKQQAMYGGSFEDPDGHMWEVFFMEPKPTDSSYAL